MSLIAILIVAGLFLFTREIIKLIFFVIVVAIVLNIVTDPHVHQTLGNVGTCLEVNH